MKASFQKPVICCKQTLAHRISGSMGHLAISTMIKGF